MRLFVALNLPAEIKGKLALAQAGLPDGAARKTGADAMHATLFFLGEVDEGKVAGICESLREAAGGIGETPGRMGAFHVSVFGVGAFPNERKPRVVWAGVQGEGLHGLATAVQHALEKIGFKPDKPFSGHITIARVREGAPPDLAGFFDKFRGEKFGGFEADCFELMKSTLLPSGPKYEAVASFRLQGQV